jgi:hypothetical protein
MPLQLHQVWLTVLHISVPLLQQVFHVSAGGIAVGNAAPAAIGATSEDPKAFGKAIIFVVLGEGIAIYGMLVSILLIFAR